MSGTRSWRRAATVMGVLALGTLAACRAGKAGDARAETTTGSGAAEATGKAPVPDDTAVVRVGPENIAIARQERIESGPAISGSLSPDREGRIRAEVSGAVLEIFVEQGQRVAAGQVLARIDDAALEDGFLSAKSGLTSAQSAADVAERELKRAQTLSAAGAIAERDLEMAVRANIGAKAGLDDASARVTAAQKQLDHARVRAPFAGIVSERQVSAGDVVGVGASLFTVVDPSSMRLEASVPAEQLDEVRPGMAVSFTVSGYSERFTGRLTRISPVADPSTRQVKIFATIPNRRSSLVGGLFAEGRISSQSHQATTIPVSAVNVRGLRPWVLLVKSGRAERRDVDLGLRDDLTDRFEVVRGVAGGDTLLTGVAQGISAGSAVRVSAPADRASARN
jgi:membrane fusion protein (multidrug efflux system)